MIVGLASIMWLETVPERGALPLPCTCQFGNSTAGTIISYAKDGSSGLLQSFDRILQNYKSRWCWPLAALGKGLRGDCHICAGMSERLVNSPQPHCRSVQATNVLEVSPFSPSRDREGVGHAFWKWRRFFWCEWKMQHSSFGILVLKES